VTLRTAHGAWICMACGEEVDRRSPQEAGIRRALSIIGRSLKP
jgi:hypothetical protein